MSYFVFKMFLHKIAIFLLLIIDFKRLFDALWNKKSTFSSWGKRYEKNEIYSYFDFIGEISFYIIVHPLKTSKFVFILFLNKFILVIQIIVGFLSIPIVLCKHIFLKKKITYSNFFTQILWATPKAYTFIIIYKFFIKRNISKKDLKVFSINIFFMFSWGSGRFLINNTIIFFKEYEKKQRISDILSKNFTQSINKINTLLNTDK